MAQSEKLDKAYPLWVAYLCASSSNPLASIKDKLKKDGMEGKYDPLYIEGLIKHVDLLMDGKDDAEKKDFYISSITGILDEKDEVELEI